MNVVLLKRRLQKINCPSRIQLAMICSSSGFFFSSSGLSHPNKTSWQCNSTDWRSKCDPPNGLSISNTKQLRSKEGWPNYLSTSNCTGNRSLPPLVGAGHSRRNRGGGSNVRWLGGLWLVPQVNILLFWWIEGHFAEENNYWYQPWHCVCDRSDYPGKDATLRRFEKFTLDHGGYQAVIISTIKRVMVWILLIYANVWRISCQSGVPSREESIDEQCQLKIIAKSAFPTIPDFSFRPTFAGSLRRDVDVLRGVQPDVCAV